MTATLKKVTSGEACGKQFIEIEGVGYIQVVKLDFYGTTTRFIAQQAKTFEMQIFSTLWDACKFLGVDGDELINTLSEPNIFEERWARFFI